VKAKTIQKVLRQKTDQWIATIEDERVRNLAGDSVIVTGGAIASMLLGEPVNDFDIYLRSREAALAVGQYYVDRFETKNRAGIPCAISLEEKGGRIRIVVKSAGIASAEGSAKPYEYFEHRPANEANAYVTEIMTDPGDIEDRNEETEQKALAAADEKPRYRPIFLSTNAITLSQKLQIILRFYGEPEAIHENYDFAHCTNYWTSWNDTLVLRPDALEALLTKELRYVGSKYPVCSVIRLRKFLARGWQINAGQILKMLMQVHLLDLLDPRVLEDQLTGVDAAYFAQVVHALHEKDPEKVNAAYLVEIIDRMF
jgi:hypothetical protein